MWRDVFTQLEGSSLAEDRERLVIEGKLHTSPRPMEGFENSKWLYWSVSIV